ncbi:MAG: type I DNA topoisomerase [Oscillospiraceae bacterium]|nr:type I DNA topoisomerase [Oscillospiraceae bacterium]
MAAAQKNTEKSLVIVESPAKAKTIQKYLGDGFEVMASNGHIRDLPKSKFGIDIDNDFKVDYTDMKGKEEVIKKLKSKAKSVGKVYLATDPDREGEAISWHLAQVLDLNLNENNRIEFTEITKTGVKNGMSNPHKINIDLVNAQQARRVLDRIVGYKLSPFLWRKIRRGLSAGRVQSVAVRLVVEREKEIKAFTAQEYWSIDAKMTAPGSRKIFPSSLSKIDGKKAVISDKTQADDILKSLENAEYKAVNVKRGQTKKNPAPPFITSTLQQEASRRMGFQAARTMRTAQQLYEGVDVKGIGTIGLITYMRTDSLRISAEAQSAALNYIKNNFGDNYLPEKPRFYKSKNNAQDAHEAIRPSTPDLTPEKVKASLSSDQYKVYKLIWERFIASQMASAVHDTMSVDIQANNYIFKASGYAVKFDGYTALYEEAKDDKEENAKMLPNINEGDIISLKEINGNQHFTQPPARYTEATLIKALEENGIGRPSTYAPTISTITARFYVERDGKQLKSTVLGETVNELMTDHFDAIVDTGFTSNMENDLDFVEKGEKNWVTTVRDFYKAFEKTLEKADKDLEGKRYKVPTEETGEMCELCGAPMIIRTGRFGKFIGCSNFPECQNTKKIIEATKGVCPLCNGVVAVKKSNKSKRKFFGCVNYPQCTFATPYTPVEDICPKCNSTMFKKGGKAGKLLCLKPDCGYERDNK